MFPGYGGVGQGAVRAFHVTVAYLIAQGPQLDVVGILMAALRTDFSIFSVRSAVAVLHPLGAFLRRVPGYVDGKHGFSPDFPAESDKVVGVYLVGIIAQ